MSAISTPLTITAVKKPKVLLLQGFNQNKEMFLQRSATFRSRYKNKFEFLMPEAPYVLPNGNRAWYVYNIETPLDIKWEEIVDKIEDTSLLYGFEESKQLIEFILKEHGEDIKYILGFSQGGSVLSILVAQGVVPSNIPVIFDAGFYPLKYSTLDDKAKLTQPNLHVIGEGDTVISPELSKKLAELLFASPKYQIHKGRHIIPRIALEDLTN